ncbi:DEAD/DEAH box helicase [Evansella tamaricis]|uniref:DEAD/DEAH box helicase n=1 Tax=Evansella tamaricis TaxID=2069301 RepID=A0ABS6JJM4_9BACI|nr:DEAD/DEAH box helicase [Evansella tamaricis]MBU9713595.1 DEAD/DEAH box helicase [Evansella tamaricis]
MNSTWSIIQSFQGFLQEGWQKSNFSNPTEIQEKAVPLIFEGKDVIAQSPTGTGKTLAYLLPILTKIDPNRKEAQTLILASSRELVMQILEEVRIWSEGSGIERAALIGGANVKRQLDKLKKKPQVIVGTPGRIVELINMKKLKIHEVKTVVFDEGDQLFSNEHVKAVDQILKATMRDKQVLVFSATVGEEVEEKAKARMNDPEVIKAQVDEKLPASIDHVYIVCEERDKITTLKKLMNTGPYRLLTFSNNINELSSLAAKLEYDGVNVGVLHRDTTKQERETAIQQFRDGKTSLLLATDVASRGLDVKGLTHVVQLEVPKDEEQYIHRAGRTGRAGAEGTVVSIVTEFEVDRLLKIGEKLSITFEKKRLYKGQLIR